MIKLDNPFYRFNYAIDSNHGASAADSSRAVHYYRCRLLRLVLPPLFDASEHLVEIFKVAAVRDHVIILPPCRLQVRDYLLLTVDGASKSENSLRHTLCGLRNAH